MELTFLFSIMMKTSFFYKQNNGTFKGGKERGLSVREGGGDRDWGTGPAVDWEALLRNFKSNSL
jgi:hypothetical protein